MREHASRVLVVVNGALTDEGRAKLEPVSDEILVRENVGFDIWAHKEALEHVGEGIAEFDEVVLTNDTWFGPVRPFGPVFDRMDARDVHFWGMTDHAREEPNPFTGKGVLPYHLQSFWIAVRREMFLSEAWREYWRDLPQMPSYFDAVLKHEALFTERFSDAGFIHAAAYPHTEYPTDHPALFNPDLLLADGCPLLKRRPLFHYPPFLDRHAVIGRRILQQVDSYGFPIAMIWQNLARNVAPKTLNADAGMLEVLPDVDVAYEALSPLSLLVSLHVADADDVGDVFTRIAEIPVPFDLVITTPFADDGAKVRERIDAWDAPNAHSVDVRVIRSPRGRHMSAFFVGCRDLLDDQRYDLVLKLHTRVPAKRKATVSRYFRRYQTENLLSSPGYLLNLLALFQREPGLGLVFPPMIHTGYATAGRGWLSYRERGVVLAKRLGIRVPLDGISPLAPLGGMWAARPAALRLIRDAGWRYEDFGAPEKKGLARTLERLVPLAAGELGYHTRTVMNAEFASLSHLSLEYKVDQLSATLPGYPIEQIQFLHRAGWAGHGGIVAITRMYMKLNHPRLARAIEPVTVPAGRAARFAIRRLRAVKARLRGGGSEDQP
nr:rhamnan synthesis F family protein [Microbacterium paulum]